MPDIDFDGKIYADATDEISHANREDLYYEYYGYWKGTQYPTSIKMPTTNKPSLKKRSDPNVYDMQGRVVRRVTDTNDPFSGLPHGVYLYQGNKYLFFFFFFFIEN